MTYIVNVKKKGCYMSKKILFSIVTIAILMSMLLVSCSSDDKTSDTKKGSTQETTKKKSNSASSENSPFQNEVTKACGKVDTSIFAGDLGINSASNLTEIAGKFGDIEDELDGLISRFEEIDAPDESADDWETIIDDLSHTRDLLPELADIFTEMQALSDSAAGISDPSEIQAFSDELTSLQNQAEDLSSDLTQTMDEVSTISEDLGISSCTS